MEKHHTGAVSIAAAAGTWMFLLQAVMLVGFGSHTLTAPAGWFVIGFIALTAIAFAAFIGLIWERDERREMLLEDVVDELHDRARSAKSEQARLERVVELMEGDRSWRATSASPETRHESE